jgi:hypothetical protein
MISPLALPDYSALAEWTPQVGDLVYNFGSVARVLEVDPERGLLVRGMPGQGFTAGHDKWHADPAKCRPVR